MAKKLTVVMAATTIGGSFDTALQTPTAAHIYAMKAIAMPHRIGAVR